MRIDKLEPMVCALDLLIERYKGREQNPRTLSELARDARKRLFHMQAWKGKEP